MAGPLARALAILEDVGVAVTIRYLPRAMSSADF